MEGVLSQIDADGDDPRVKHGMYSCCREEGTITLPRRAGVVHAINSSCVEMLPTPTEDMISQQSTRNAKAFCVSFTSVARTSLAASV
jgi:hypothetical protein